MDTTALIAEAVKPLLDQVEALDLLDGRGFQHPDQHLGAALRQVALRVLLEPRRPFGVPGRAVGW